MGLSYRDSDSSNGLRFISHILTATPMAMHTENYLFTETGDRIAFPQIAELIDGGIIPVVKISLGVVSPWLLRGLDGG